MLPISSSYTSPTTHVQLAVGPCGDTQTMPSHRQPQSSQAQHRASDRTKSPRHRVSYMSLFDVSVRHETNRVGSLPRCYVHARACFLWYLRCVQAHANQLRRLLWQPQRRLLPQQVLRPIYEKISGRPQSPSLQDLLLATVADAGPLGGAEECLSAGIRCPLLSRWVARRLGVSR